MNLIFMALILFSLSACALSPATIDVASPAPLRSVELVIEPQFNVRFIKLPQATFSMGSPSFEKERWDDETPRQVFLTNEVQIQNSEVTQGEWLQLMAFNPSRFSSSKDCPNEHSVLNEISLCPNNPVDSVSWLDVQLFLEKLNQRKDGFKYRLPSEAEWEFAARSGSVTTFFFGNSAASLEEYSWYEANSSAQTHPVRKKKANGFGLYDVYGNVWEWVLDWHGPYPDKPERDPMGPLSGTSRVIRGGSFGNDAYGTRSANRGLSNPQNRSPGVGFRLARTAADTLSDASVNSIVPSLQEFTERLELALKLTSDAEGEIKIRLENVLKKDLHKLNAVKFHLSALIENYKPKSASSFRRQLLSIESMNQFRELNQLSKKVIDEIFSTDKAIAGRTELEKSLLTAFHATGGFNDQFIHVTPSEFIMGSSNSQPGAEANEIPHVIRNLEPFEMQTKELTQAQWVRVMGYNPSEFSRTDDCPFEHERKSGVEYCSLHPLENVSWNEVQIFLSRLNLVDQTYQYRLPTEVEWEFAARGGTSTAFYFGDSPAELHKYGWWYKNSNNKSHSVGLKRPNPYGFHDMHGNVWEWTGDWYRPYSATESNQKFRTIRGGSWFSDHPNLRSANRGNAAPTSRVPFIGLRLVRYLKADASNR